MGFFEKLTRRGRRAGAVGSYAPNGKRDVEALQATLEDRLKLLLLGIIYDELGLGPIEEELSEAGVPHKEIIAPDGAEPVSRYFFLNNDVSLGRLNGRELAMVKQLVASGDESERQRLSAFLAKNKLRLLLPDTDAKYLFWNYANVDHAAPADAVVIAFHTLKYCDGADERTKAEWAWLVCQRLNYIQYVAGPRAGYKVAALEYDEVLIGYFDGYKEATW